MTKLKASTLVKLFKEKFESEGFIFFKAPFSHNLFVKKIDATLFISMVFNVDRFYESRFTIDLYIATNTRWNCLWGDIPFECMQRVGGLLTKAERLMVLPEDDHSSEPFDLWWDAWNPQDLEKFMTGFLIALKRLENPPQDLRDKIKASKAMAELNLKTKITQDNFVKYSGSKLLKPSEFAPKKPIKGIDDAWFTAAEQTYLDLGIEVNKNMIFNTVYDAYLQTYLSSPRSSD
jgi:hypothetical protein